MDSNVQMLFRHTTYELMDELSYRLRTGVRSIAYRNISTQKLWEYIKETREATILNADAK